MKKDKKKKQCQHSDNNSIGPLSLSISGVRADNGALLIRKLPTWSLKEFKPVIGSRQHRPVKVRPPQDLYSPLTLVTWYILGLVRYYETSYNIRVIIKPSWSLNDYPRHLNCNAYSCSSSYICYFIVTLMTNNEINELN